MNPIDQQATASAVEALLKEARTAIDMLRLHRDMLVIAGLSIYPIVASLETQASEKQIDELWCLHRLLGELKNAALYTINRLNDASAAMNDAANRERESIPPVAANPVVH